MSLNTYKSYCSDIVEMMSFLETRKSAVGKGIDPSLVDKGDIVSYLEFRTGIDSPGVPVSERTQARILSSLRSFFSWLVIEGVIQDNPCDGIEAPKLGRYLPAVLSVDEVAAIMDSVDLSTWSGKRDRAILEMLYGLSERVTRSALCRWVSHRGMLSGRILMCGYVQLTMIQRISCF